MLIKLILVLELIKHLSIYGFNFLLLKKLVNGI